MFVGPSVQYIVDFAPQLSEIILESKYLEQAGFSVPELARNVALQVWLLLIVMSYMFYFVGFLKLSVHVCVCVCVCVFMCVCSGIW